MVQTTFKKVQPELLPDHTQLPESDCMNAIFRDLRKPLETVPMQDERITYFLCLTVP